MRLNRGTIALIVVALVVIIGVVILNNNQAAAPGVTPTPQTQSLALWSGVDQNTIARLEVRDNQTGQALVLVKDSQGNWQVSDVLQAEQGQTASDNLVSYVPPQDLPIDATKVTAAIGSFTGLQASDQFDSETPVDFGLATPTYTIYATTGDNAVYVMHVGNKNPNNTRYYVVAEQIAGATVTPEATDMQQGSPRINEGNGNTSPANTLVPAATELVGANPTVNALANAIAEATSDAAVTEAAEALSAAVSATNAAVGAEAAAAMTAEATAESTHQGSAIATENPRADVSTSIELTVEATDAATAEATVEIPLTAEATAQTSAEATPRVLSEPLVTLTGKQTVRLVPQDVITSILGLLSTPPYIFPTATPPPLPTANPYSEVQQTATAAVQGTAVMAELMTTMQAMQTSTAQAATTATAEATAAPASGGG